MQLEGDIRPVFQQMLTLSAWIDVARALNGTLSGASDPEWYDEWQVVGRYVNVTLDGPVRFVGDGLISILAVAVPPV